MSNRRQIPKFLAHVRSQCRKLNVVFRLSKSEGINSGDGEERLLGIFIHPIAEKPGSLRVAVKNRRMSSWIVDVAHEYVHMMQWFRGDKLYESHFRGDVSYSKLEAATEKEALILLKAWGIGVGVHQQKRSKRYIAKLRVEEKSLAC